VFGLDPLFLDAWDMSDPVGPSRPRIRIRDGVCDRRRRQPTTRLTRGSEEDEVPTKVSDPCKGVERSPLTPA
jgi:hypothetical protein